LGFIKTFGSLIKAYVRKCQGQKKLFFNAFDVNFILTIYENPITADTDENKVISPKEAIALAITLAIDNLAVGVGVGLLVSPFVAAPLTIVTDFLAISLGLWIGKKVAGTGFDFSLVSGIVLMILAFV